MDFYAAPQQSIPPAPPARPTLAGAGQASQDEGWECLRWPSPGPTRASGVAPSSSETTLSWHLFLHALLTWYRREHAAQAAIQRHTAPYRTRGSHGKGTKAASVSTSATSDRMIPVVSSDQDMVKVETRSPLVSPARRSSVTAGAGRGAGCYVGVRGDGKGAMEKAV
jgi:hypothetical protein